MQHAQDVFDESPHLAAFVSRLHLDVTVEVVPVDFERLAIVSRSFTVLRDLSLNLPAPLPSQLLAPIQTLLGIPSMMSVRVHFRFERLNDLVDLWRNCSRNIRRVEFTWARSVKLPETPDDSAAR
ncbi:hypothetical protein FB45DRAFT_1031736 [Roridomyces roridus]|uniref:Uncharacterized protein n=1 Tax=Roridomyces roridus TaxID=1738132 RepID=A0AAD7BIP8_9AGAR|nr:hypothetical protein FB45DRAFT_1031736 [Roridomyces roridus]